MFMMRSVVGDTKDLVQKINVKVWKNRRFMISSLSDEFPHCGYHSILSAIFKNSTYFKNTHLTIRFILYK